MEYINKLRNYFNTDNEESNISNNMNNEDCSISNTCFEDKIYKNKAVDVRFNRMIGLEDDYKGKVEQINENIPYYKKLNNGYHYDMVKEYANLGSLYNTVRPIEQINVKPGVNIGYNGENSDDYGKSTSLYNRVIPQHLDIDNLRNELNKQQSYTFPVNKVPKYIKSGKLGRVELTDKKLFDSKGINRNKSAVSYKKQGIKPNITLNESKINVVSSNNLIMAPYNINQGVTLPGNYQEPLKIGPHNKSQSNISHYNKFNNYHSEVSSTKKELHLMDHNSNNNMQINKTFINNTVDVPNTTLKDQYNNDKMNVNIKNSSNFTYSSLQDELKHTQKEKNILLQKNTNINLDKHMSGPSILDDIKHTNKENLILLSINNYIKSNGNKLTSEIQDELHTTKKEFNLLNPNNNLISQPIKKLIIYFQDNIRETLKELNILNDRSSNIKGGTKDYYIDYTQIPDATLKDLLCNSYKIGIATGVIKQNLLNLNDIPAATLKELLLHENYNILNKVNNGMYLPMLDSLRQTLKNIKAVLYCGIVNGYKQEIDRNAKIFLTNNRMDIDYELSKIVKGVKNSNNNIPEVDKLGNVCVNNNQLNIDYNIGNTKNNINNYPSVKNIGNVCVNTNNTINSGDRIINISDQLSSNPYVNNLINKFN